MKKIYLAEMNEAGEVQLPTEIMRHLNITPGLDSIDFELNEDNICMITKA